MEKRHLIRGYVRSNRTYATSFKMKTLNLNNISNHLSNNWKDKYGSFLSDENLTVLINNLKFITEKETLFPLPLPHFKEDITHLALKKLVLNKIEFNEMYLAQFIENEKFENILVLSGQRLTPASVRNETAIPPHKNVLLESCFSSFNNQISFAVRAWEKHVGRTENSFWGTTVKGNPKEKEQQVKKIIMYCLEHKTWWNVFFHYKHELVYEIRIPNGQGIRWTNDGKKLIGFLEPFL